MDSLQLSDPSLDDDLRLLADRYRRLILEYLIQESPGPVPIDALVDYFAGHRIADSNRETIQTELHHRHLPKIADHGLIEYDPRSRTLRYHPRDRIETILERIPDD